MWICDFFPRNHFDVYFLVFILDLFSVSLAKLCASLVLCNLWYNENLQEPTMMSTVTEAYLRYIVVFGLRNSNHLREIHENWNEKCARLWLLIQLGDSFSVLAMLSFSTKTIWFSSNYKIICPWFITRCDPFNRVKINFSLTQ